MIRHVDGIIIPVSAGYNDFSPFKTKVGSGFEPWLSTNHRFVCKFWANNLGTFFGLVFLLWIVSLSHDPHLTQKKVPKLLALSVCEAEQFVESFVANSTVHFVYVCAMERCFGTFS